MDGGGVSAAAIEVLVQNVINVFKEERSLLRGLDGDAQQLQRTLGMIQAYLNDAEKKSITQDAVKIWLRELEAVAFDADNVVDELSYHLLHKRVNKMKTPKDKVLSCFSSLNHISRPRNIALRIKQINTSFENMNKRATELGLQSIVVNAPAAAALNASFETDSFSIDPIFIGRDDDLPILVDKLIQICPEERTFSTLAIVGMGGMGKTTLTRKIFNHQRVKTRFGSRLWVHVSQNFDPMLLFKKILFKMAKNTSDGVESRDDDILETRKTTDGVETREDILEKLQEALKVKTYLLVLDDIWNQDVPTWEGFINSLSGVTSTKGNGIIITTRSQKVASTVKPIDIHMLTGLSDEDCWSIIKAKTFDENGEVPSGFEMIGKKIAKRCKGLPLAANVVGGVLRCKSQEEWLEVEQRWLTDVDGDNISKILRLSFDNLSSPSLKKCFTYCSIFPKGRRIVKQQLIELWMAEGFLQPNGRDDMESVGDMFFNMLLQNSLLQVAERDDIGNVESCMMHDLVHDLASSVLGSHNADGCNQIRYITLQGSKPVPKQVAKQLRTLFLEGEEIPGNMLSNLESLHVLTLKSYGVEELPNSVRKMIHLRNLNISNTRIKNLPDWISEFHHLQTLRAKWLWNSPFLLPSTLKYLINLRHLYIENNVQLPAEIGRLTCLQTLRHFKVGDNKGYQIEELGSLKNLKGQLVISSLEKVRGKEEAEKAKIFEKPNLFDLGFQWDAYREGERDDDKNVLEGLQPHANANLKKLEIYGFKGKRFPEWIEKMAVRDGPQGSWLRLTNLIEVTLWRCRECEEIPQLEHLPNLKSLCLIGLEKVRFINSSFSKLMSLKIEKLEGLECLPDWLFYKNQNLSELEISGCPRLRELPDGLDTLNSLEKLTIYECRNVKSIGNPSGRQGQSQGILRQLRIERCEGLMVLPSQMLESWAPTIESLELRDLNSLKSLPMVIDCLAKAARLTDLRIGGVPIASVKSWGLGCLERVEMDVSWEWSMESSVGIKQTVDALLQGCCNSLTQLEFGGVENWEWLPESIQHLTALDDSLTLENLGVQELPEWLGNLPSLERLYLISCNKLRRLPSCWGDALKELHIINCGELRIDPIPAEWHNNFPNLTVWVDGRKIKPCSKTSAVLS